MNDMTPNTGTAIALPATTEILPLFTTENGTEALIAKIEAAAAAFIPDTTTKKGRDEIASMAFKVTKSKTALKAMAKDAKEDAAKTVKAVNAETSRIETRLDALRDKTRQPLTDWEAAEEERKAKQAELLAKFDVTVNPLWTSEELAGVLMDVEAVVIDATYGAAEGDAHIAKSALIDRIKPAIAAAKQREKDAAELEELRALKAANEAAEIERQRAAEIAEREVAQRAEQERLEAERVDREKREAEELAAKKVRDEEERIAQAARQKQIDEENAETARREEAERAAIAAKEAEERHARELKEAAEREAAAVQAERDRIAKIEQDEIDAKAAREADLNHRNKITGSIRDALMAFVGGDQDMAADISTALVDGKIPHVAVSL